MSASLCLPKFKESFANVYIVYCAVPSPSLSSLCTFGMNDLTVCQRVKTFCPRSCYSTCMHQFNAEPLPLLLLFATNSYRYERNCKEHILHGLDTVKDAHSRFGVIITVP